MKIEFDHDKNAINFNKHGISLAFGSEILADPNRLEILDVRFDYEEERFVCYGNVQGRVWVCVYTNRNHIPRMISVRKANDRETKRYEDTPR